MAFPFSIRAPIRYPDRVTKEIEPIVAALFRTLPVAFEEGTVTADAEAGLHGYVRYWVTLGAARQKVIDRCEHVIARVRRRCVLDDQQDAAADRVAAALLERCAHHYAGLSALHPKW